MTDLYRRHGSAPAPLPTIAYDSAGNAFTPPYANDDLTMLGFLLAPDRPDDTEAQMAEWDAKKQKWAMIDRPAPPPPDMPALRAEALATAMAYGNAITAREIGQWAGVEPLSWTQQRDEALIVRGGGALDEFAVLPGLASDKGVTLEAYADDVLDNAARYQAILRAAVYLRRSAQSTLTDAALDTPAKLDAAVATLQAEADALAAQLIAA